MGIAWGLVGSVFAIWFFLCGTALWARRQLAMLGRRAGCAILGVEAAAGCSAALLPCRGGHLGAPTEAQRAWRFTIFCARYPEGLRIVFGVGVRGGAAI